MVQWDAEQVRLAFAEACNVIRGTPGPGRVIEPLTQDTEYHREEARDRGKTEPAADREPRGPDPM